MTCIPLHKTWQMSLLWLMDPLVSEQRWLAYHYPKCGRWTYFGWTQWQRFESSSTHHFWDTPQHFLKTHFCLESGFPSFLVPEKRWHAYHYTQFGRWTYFGWTQWQRFESSSTHHFWDTPQHFLKTHFCLESGFLSFVVPEQRWLAYHYSKLGRWTYFGWWTPPGTRSEMPCIPLQNLADEPNLAEHNGKGLKALALTISEILHSIFSKHIFA